MAKSKQQRLNALGSLADDLKSSLSNEPDPDVLTLKNEDVKTQKSKNVTKKPPNMPWYPPSMAIRKELKQLALDEDTTIQALFTESIKDLFEKRGKRFDDFI